MYRKRSPLRFLAVMTAILGGVLLAIGHWIPGAILVGAAVVLASADYFDKDDSSGLY